MPAIIDSTSDDAYGRRALSVRHWRGSFAVTLLAGIAASLFTSIFVVRAFFLLWLNRTRGARR